MNLVYIHSLLPWALTYYWLTNEPQHVKRALTVFLCPRPERSAGGIWCLDRPSVCPFICNSVRLTNKVQYLKLGWSYSNQTWTVSSSMGFHWHPMPLGGWARSKCRTWRFCHILTLLLAGSSVFHKHMSSLSKCLFFYFLNVHYFKITLGNF